MTAKQMLAVWRRKGYLTKSPSGYILWLGPKDSHGYAQASVNGKRRLIHRYLWETYKGPAEGMLCHTCDVPNCIKLAHMYVGTAKTNRQDWKERRRPENFSCGHPRVNNTGLNNQNTEYCRICRTDSTRRWEERKRA